MKLSMHENSLFAVLLRSPWWVSALVALGFGGLAQIIVPDVYAAFVALPFLVIAVYSARQQLRRPSAARIARSLEHLRSLSWDDFSRALEEAYRREGYTVKRLGAPPADFELVQGSRSTLVACKRWKATRTGIEPLRELHAAWRAREAHECFYVVAGEVTEGARAFATKENIRLVQGAELATLLRFVARVIAS